MTTMDHGAVLNALARADRAGLCALAEALLPDLGDVTVVHSRTGLVMLPLRDTVKGTDFHLGEVLVAEAQIRLGPHDGYGLVLGHDLELAMAMAVADLAWQRHGPSQQAVAEFAARAADAAQAQDEMTFRKIEATRVQMETF